MCVETDPKHGNSFDNSKGEFVFTINFLGLVVPYGITKLGSTLVQIMDYFMMAAKQYLNQCQWGPLQNFSTILSGS